MNTILWDHFYTSTLQNGPSSENQQVRKKKFYSIVGDHLAKQ